MINVSIFLDSRYQKKDQRYPAKIRVYSSMIKKTKFYSIPYNFTEEEFKSVYESKKPRGEFKQLKKQLMELELKASVIANDIKDFSFEEFEKLFFSNKRKKDSRDFFVLFDEIVEAKKALGSISTAEKYALAKRSMQKYLQYHGKKDDALSIDFINADFLERYSSFMERVLQLSPATMGIYLRNVRAVYRYAIKKGISTMNHYPFQDERVKIPKSQKVNKALNENELRLIWEHEVNDNKMSFAKDMWFFSYFAYGMNMRDICELKHASIRDNAIHYVRAKTRNTKKQRVEKIIPLTDSISNIIGRRKNTESEFLFGLLSPTDSPEERHKKVKLVTVKVNKYFRRLLKEIGMDNDWCKSIGTYAARHSFTTVAIRKGKSHALISEILHDGNLQMTANYINSFPKEDLIELSREMEF